MKKKHRDIIVDGENWAWRAYKKDSWYQYDVVEICKDKKIIYENTCGDYFGRRRMYSIKPGLIARFIKRYLKTNKNQ
jgi:hypothetical protein